MHSISGADEAEVGLGVFGLAADGNAPDPLDRGGAVQGIEESLERRQGPGHQLEHPHLVLGATGGKGRRMPEGEREELAAVAQQRRVADAQLMGEGDLPRKIDARRELVGQPPALLDALLQRGPGVESNWGAAPTRRGTSCTRVTVSGPGTKPSRL